MRAPNSNAETLDLSQALATIAVLMGNSYVSFGVELQQTGTQPHVTLRVKDGQTVKEALDAIFAQAPSFEYRVVSDHVIDVYPKGALDYANSPLNLRVSHFDVEDAPAAEVFMAPALFIRELQTPQDKTRIWRFLGPFGSPHVTLHLRNVTVREGLNAVSEQSNREPDGPHGFGWIFDPQAAGAPEGRQWQMFRTPSMKPAQSPKRDPQ